MMYCLCFIFLFANISLLSLISNPILSYSDPPPPPHPPLPPFPSCTVSPISFSHCDSPSLCYGPHMSWATTDNDTPLIRRLNYQRVLTLLTGSDHPHPHHETLVTQRQQPPHPPVIRTKLSLHSTVNTVSLDQKLLVSPLYVSDFRFSYGPWHLNDSSRLRWNYDGKFSSPVMHSMKCSPTSIRPSNPMRTL